MLAASLPYFLLHQMQIESPKLSSRSLPLPLPVVRLLSFRIRFPRRAPRPQLLFAGLAVPLEAIGALMPPVKVFLVLHYLAARTALALYLRPRHKGPLLVLFPSSQGVALFAPGEQAARGLPQRGEHAGRLGLVAQGTLLLVHHHLVLARAQLNLPVDLHVNERSENVPHLVLQVLFAAKRETSESTS